MAVVNGAAVVFVVLVVTAGLVLVVRAGEREWAQAIADREWVRSIDRARPLVAELPEAVSDVRPAPRPYDWSRERDVLEFVPKRARARAKGGAA